MSRALASSRALWNRAHLDLRSEETLAQIMDRGEVAAWRELYALAKADDALRDRMLHVVATVPMLYGPMWWAALSSGEGHASVSTEAFPTVRDTP